MLFSGPECAKTPVDLLRLWMHESKRVYRDKLVDEKDIETFDKIIKETVKKNFEVCCNSKQFYY
jgi:dynein heavy chain